MPSHDPRDQDQTAPGKLVRELIGHVWADSGQLIITDPGYMEDLDFEMIDSATNLKQRHSLIMDGMAVALRSGIRNSRYPVYVTRFENGAIAKIEIEFAEQLAP
jgi:hypothetical protein